MWVSGGGALILDAAAAAELADPAELDGGVCMLIFMNSCIAAAACTWDIPGRPPAAIKRAVA